jgi:uncharacterized membrane protein
MRRKKIPILLIIIITITGIQTVFAQSGRDVTAETAATERTVQEKEAVININLISDKDFIQALQTASDVELINEESAKTEKNDKDTNQRKPK